MYKDIPELEAALLQCSQCELNNTYNLGATTYNGLPAARLMLVGEGPGQVEDEYGVPLVGPSGQLLDKALKSVGITRDCIYTTNVVKCRPRGNRTPTVQEGMDCANRWLVKEIELVKPDVIVALGSVALKYFKDENARITKERGNWFTSRDGVACIATYHPAYLLRLTGKQLVEAKWQVYYDLKAAVEKTAQISPNYVFGQDQMPNLLELYTGRKLARAAK